MEEESSGIVLCDTFWNEDLTWNTDLPRVTRCFRRVVFSLAPLAIFWLVLPIYVFKLRRKSLAANIELSALSVAKFLANGFLTVLALIDLCFWSLDQNLIGLDVAEAALRFLTFVSVIVVIKVKN